MDRSTCYFGALVQETDLLKAEQFGMTGLAYACQAFGGTATFVDGFTCTPTSPAALAVNLNPGAVYSLANLEATIWSSLPQDIAHSIVKQGIMKDVDRITITPPGTVGFSQYFLIEVQYADLDTNPVLYPYFNAANPAQPFQGPNNSGVSQNSVRLGIVAVQVKAGVAAATGTQVAPSADAGWTGLFLVLVANGQATITSGNITQLANAPFIQAGAKLPVLPNSIQNSLWTYALDSGTASNLAVTLTPPPTAYVDGMAVIVRAANAPTGASTINVNGLGNKPIIHGDGTAVYPNDWSAGTDICLIYDATRSSFQMAWKGAAIAPTLSAPLNLYVATTGSDTLNTGLSPSSPFLTIQKALNVSSIYNLNGFSITINVANGTYNVSGPVSCPANNGAGQIFITGNVASPSSVVVNSSLGSAFILQAGSRCTISGFTVIAPTPNNATGDGGYGIASISGAACRAGAIVYGVCGTAHLFATGGGTIGLDGPMTITGSTQSSLFALVSGSIILNQTTPPPLTIANAVTITNFWGVSALGTIYNPYGTITGAGNVTGNKYSAITNGVINTGGQGTGYLPGTGAGSTATGGQYA